MGTTLYMPPYPGASAGLKSGWLQRGFGGGGGGAPAPPAFTFPEYAGFDSFTQGEFPTAAAPVSQYFDAGSNVTRAIGYGTTVAPDYPVATVYNQTQQLHRAIAPGSSGVEFDLGDAAINPSTTTDDLRVEFFGQIRYGTRGYFYFRLSDTPFGGGTIQNSVYYYWTWASAGSWGRVHTITNEVNVEEGGLGAVGWDYPYGNPGQVIQVWNVEFKFPTNQFKCQYSCRQDTNIGRTAGAWNTVTETGPANLNADLRYIQIYGYGDGTGARDQSCIHAWVGTQDHAYPDGVKQ